MTTMLLDGVKSNTSIDQPKYINVNLTGNQKAFKKAKIDETMDLYALYKKEKNSCTRYRMLFVINPVCTNVLFNRKTEVVSYEGSDSCITLSDYATLNEIVDGDLAEKEKELVEHIKRGKNTQYSKDANLKLFEAIRDTEFSNEYLGNLTYHCGADMCNNHIMRAKEFVFSNYVTKKSNEVSSRNFNTIEDVVRTENGIEEFDYISVSSSIDKKPYSRLYSVDSIMTYDESFSMNLYEKDGWIGFDNVSNININNLEFQSGNGAKDTKNISVNRIINNIGACSFVDLYPDRTLFSAVPKYNKYRNRKEHNWDYCLTYPYASDEEVLFKINGHAGDFSSVGNIGMPMVVSNVIYSSAGEKAIVFKTLVNHNLHMGRFITITVQIKSDTGVETKTYTDRIQVIGVGTEEGFDKEKYFAVRASDMPSGLELKNNLGEYYYVPTNKSLSNVNVLFSYKNNINNVDCKYYVRKFKKLKNLEGDDLRYDVSKIAFGNNIYGDEMAQVMFNDDVELGGLVDNLGRELSEIYLTIIKTNRGHELWYKRPESNSAKERAILSTKNKQSEEIEFSHCFGKLTSGIVMNDGGEDYNVEKLHNLNISNGTMGKIMFYDTNGKNTNYYSGTSILFGTITPPCVIEDNITSNGSDMLTDEFYGDIVEFDQIQYTETILAPIYYRFNTEQRECWYNEEYFNIYKDEVVSDNFEVTVEDGDSVDNDREFSVSQSLLNVTEFITGTSCVNENGSESNAGTEKAYIAGNLNPEGYYYNPHHKIVVKELSDELEEVETDRLNIDKTSDENFVIYNGDGSGSYKLVRLYSPRDYGFNKGGSIVFYDRISQKAFYGVIDTVIGKQTLFVRVNSSAGIEDVSNGPISIDNSFIPNELVGFIPDNGRIYRISDEILVLSCSKTIPTYAIFRPSTGSFVWRPTINVTDVTSASTLYDIPFSNGAIYIEKNLNIFLKRQDPRGENCLYNYTDRPKSGGDDASATSSCTFLRKEGMPKLDIRYLLEGDDNISFDLC